MRPIHGSWWTTGLVVVLLLSQAVWVGGLVVIAVVARVARQLLSPAQQVDFFRKLGRTYGPVGGVALVLGLLTGAVLAQDHPWDGSKVIAALVAAALVVATLMGVVHARRVTQLRQAALAAPWDGPSSRMRGQVLLATGLRGLLVLLTLAEVFLAATLLS